jgi:hypothetical protein
MRAWATELFCDLFAVLGVGPAYAWAHLHLCAKSGNNPFEVETSPDSTHPPDEARMFILLEALARLNYAKVSSEIESRWKELVAARNFKRDADYDLCFPKNVLKQFVEEAHNGYKAMNCRCSLPNSGHRVHDLLNQAWSKFWKSPRQYADWEKRNGLILPKR